MAGHADRSAGCQCLQGKAACSATGAVSAWSPSPAHPGRACYPLAMHPHLHMGTVQLHPQVCARGHKHCNKHWQEQQDKQLQLTGRAFSNGQFIAAVSVTQMGNVWQLECDVGTIVQLLIWILHSGSYTTQATAFLRHMHGSDRGNIR